MLLADKLRITPFARIILPFCAGIVAAEWIGAPLWLMALVAAGLYGAAWLIKEESAANGYAFGAIFVTGILLTAVNRRGSVIPQGERVMIVAEVMTTPVESGRWSRATAEVGYFRPYDAPQRELSGTGDYPSGERTGKGSGGAENKTGGFSQGEFPGSGGGELSGSAAKSTKESTGQSASLDLHRRPAWQRVSQRIQLYVDTCYSLSLGEQVSAVTFINPIDTTGSRYGALMRSRGFGGRAYVVPGRMIGRMEAPERSIAYYSARMQAWSVGRLARLRASPESRQMSIALVTGYRPGLDRTVNNEYSRVGVSHILSVSGLHMGFVFVLVNLLLGWVVLFRRGHILKNILVIAALWVYAMTAGLSPSVVRAALMLTAAQAALGTSSWGNSYNIILGAATVMLAVNPFYLFDISFQLSFMAVLSIIFLYPRLYRRRLGHSRVSDVVRSSLLLGVAAQIGVMPLVAYNFGNIPIIALIINPIVIFTAFIIVTTGLLWLVLGWIPLMGWALNPAAGFVTEWAVRLQNGVVHWAAGTPVASISNLNLSAWGAGLCYLVLGSIALWIKIYEEQHPYRPKYKSGRGDMP